MSASRPQRGVLDTSVFIAREKGRTLRSDLLPLEAAISVVTRAELRAGILVAATTELRDQRLSTLESVARMTVLPIWGPVDRAWAGMRAYLAASGRLLKANDIWIAATAATYEIPVVTQDADFDALNGVGGLTVIQV